MHSDIAMAPRLGAILAIDPLGGCSERVTLGWDPTDILVCDGPCEEAAGGPLSGIHSGFE
jgi:hypothetical protein